jgi:GWxTD domain-containing protein
LLRNSDNSPAFKNYFASAESFRISAGDGKREKLYVKRFKDQFTAAYPPFSDKKDGRIVLKPDSLFVISLKDNVTAPLTLKKPGIYYFQPDTAIKKGLTVLRYYDDYPEITSPANMLNPLLYLTSKSEYDKILMLKDKKTGIDNFWIEIAGNPDRARQLIIKYYTRVKEANQMFISHTEGWKTDRGIIYIVYGQPNVVYKNADTETWIYGSVNSPRSIRFNFYKTLNPFSDNDFVLDRSQNYKNSWYVAVEAWRR